MFYATTISTERYTYCPMEDRWDVLGTCPMEDRWDVLGTLSLLSHGGQVGCPKDSVPIVPWRTGGMS